jgi:hypothetical protein
MSMYEVDVLVISPEAALDGVAEVRSQGRLVGVTSFQDGELVRELAGAPEEDPLKVNAESLRLSLIKAKGLLAQP